MDRLIWEQRPTLRDPIALLAFEGWGDAGESSSMAVRYLIDEFDADRLARIDSDDFFDFQVRRPEIELDHEGTREVLWPDCEVWAVRPFGAERDLVIITGHEPHTRWKAFSRDIVTVLDTLGVGIAVTMGAFIGQVPHTLPVPLVGSSSRPDLLERHSLFTSGYEGPTGIVGVLNSVLNAAGFETLSVWAAVPHYLSNQEYPPGGLALLDKVLEILDLSLDTSELTMASAEFRQQVDDALADSEIIDYVQELESHSLTGDDTVDPAELLVEEIERFLEDG
ncbi:MAG TPA: PAC2 family protein [Acidimicrobiia bacterium]|jgi:proteasome assembly chaperone (PAC2) family protein